jgi:hypothetical protein
LSYPEILPEQFHKDFLYQNDDELEVKLRQLLRAYDKMAEVKKALAESMQKFDWRQRIDEFDSLFDVLVANKSAGARTAPPAKP